MWVTLETLNGSTSELVAGGGGGGGWRKEREERTEEQVGGIEQINKHGPFLLPIYYKKISVLNHCWVIA